jgi:signal peptidase II
VTAPADPFMSARGQPATVALIVIACTLVADFTSKQFILNVVMKPARVIEIAPFLNVSLGFNSGISFGLLRDFFVDRPLLLAIVSGVITAGIFVWSMSVQDAGERVGLGLMAGGAAGNSIDRWHRGAVTDFLDFHLGSWHWPAFNIADVALTMGVLTLIVAAIRQFQACRLQPDLSPRVGESQIPAPEDERRRS